MPRLPRSPAKPPTQPDQPGLPAWLASAPEDLPWAVALPDDADGPFIELDRSTGAPAAPRYPFNASLLLKTEGQEATGEAVNLSETGLGCRTPLRLGPGETVFAEFSVPTWRDGSTVGIACEVAWAAADGVDSLVGMRFLAPTPRQQQALREAVGEEGPPRDRGLRSWKPVSFRVGAGTGALCVLAAALWATDAFTGGLATQPPNLAAGDGPLWVHQNLDDLEYLTRDSDVVVLLPTQQAPKQHVSFWLPNPRRLVIDVPGAVPALTATRYPMGHPLAQLVRVGAHADKVRFVIETSEVAPSSEVTHTPDGLRVTLRP